MGSEELKRIASFLRVEDPKFRPMRMASAGFTLTTDGKGIVCHCCGITVSLNNLSKDDITDPVDLHKRRSPRCDLLQRILTTPPPRGKRISDLLQRSSKQSIGEKKVARRDNSEPAASARPKQPKISCTKRVLRNRSFEAEKESLQRSIADQKDRFQCKVCLDAFMDTVFLPCGHFSTCKECADKLRVCSMCRETIKGTVAVLDFYPLKK